jgi:hypothetical protein
VIEKGSSGSSNSSSQVPRITCSPKRASLTVTSPPASTVLTLDGEFQLSRGSPLYALPSIGSPSRMSSAVGRAARAAAGSVVAASVSSAAARSLSGLPGERSLARASGSSSSGDAGSANHRIARGGAASCAVAPSVAVFGIACPDRSSITAAAGARATAATAATSAAPSGRP